MKRPRFTSSLPTPEARARAIEGRIEDVRTHPGMGLTWYGGADTIPRGWLKRDGSTLSIAEHPALFAAIGNKFGGVAGQTFRLPSDQPSAGIGIIKT